MNATQYENLFKGMGSIIALYNYNESDSKVEMLDASRGMVSNNASYNSQIRYVQGNLKSANDTIVAYAAQLTSTLLNAISNSIKNTVKEQLPSTNTTEALILDDLIADMIAGSQTVFTGGVFKTFFTNTYSKNLPESGTPTIDDSWAELA